MSSDHEAPHYVVFSTPLLPYPSWVQISSPAPYSLWLLALMNTIIFNFM